MTEMKFRPGWYENDPDPPVTVCDVETAYAEARRVYDPSYSHPQWGDVAKNKACILIDLVTLGAHDNGIELSATKLIHDCVSRWDEFRGFVRRHDRRIVLGQEPSIGALLKAFEHAVRFFLTTKAAFRRAPICTGGTKCGEQGQ